MMVVLTTVIHCNGNHNGDGSDHNGGGGVGNEGGDGYGGGGDGHEEYDGGSGEGNGRWSWCPRRCQG